MSSVSSFIAVDTLKNATFVRLIPSHTIEKRTGSWACSGKKQTEKQGYVNECQTSDRENMGESGG